MAFTFKLKAGNVPSGKNCLVNLQETLKGVELYVTVEGPEGITATIISEQAPGVDDQDKTWVKLHPNGKPEGFYVFAAGGWIRIPFAFPGFVGLFTGQVANIPAGWHLANGVAPSTVDLTNNTTYGQLWEPAYSAPVTAYSLCLIQYVGLQA